MEQDSFKPAPKKKKKGGPPARLAARLEPTDKASEDVDMKNEEEKGPGPIIAPPKQA